MSLGESPATSTIGPKYSCSEGIPPRIGRNKIKRYRDAVTAHSSMRPGDFAGVDLARLCENGRRARLQLWRARHSLPINSGRLGGLPILHRRTVAVPSYAYPELSLRRIT